MFVGCWSCHGLGGWNDLNSGPRELLTKNLRLSGQEKEGAVLNADESLILALAAVDYFIAKCTDDVFSHDDCSSALVRGIHTRAQAVKACHDPAFDVVAITRVYIIFADDSSTSLFR